jgi:hypothetical protein
MDAFLEELSSHENRRIRTAIHPQLWTSFVVAYDLEWQYLPFNEYSQSGVPALPGVYCFYIGHSYKSLPRVGYVMYHGITVRTLRQRYGEYLREKNDAKGRVSIRKLLKVFEGELEFACASVDTRSVDLTKLELELGGALMPPYSVKDLPAEIKAARNAWQ